MKKRGKELNVGEKIRGLRKMHRMRQKTLARMVGITHGALTDFEKGRRRISVNWLRKISEALHIPLAYFLEDSEPQSKIIPGDPREKRLLDAWRHLRSDILQKDFLRLMEHLGDLGGTRKPRR